MAERRTLHKKISLSETIDQMTEQAQLFFTWCIPHADDVGLLPRSAKILKGTVFPLKEITADEVEAMILECVENNLFTVLEHKGKQFLHIKNFDEHQTLRKDRQPQTILEISLKKDARTNWNEIEKVIDSHMTVISQAHDNKRLTEVKGSEVKGSEGKGKKRAPEAKKSNNEEKDIYDIPFFNEFWTEYPKKTGKGEALKSWKKLKPSKTLSLKVIATVRAYAKTDQWKEQKGRFIPNPATFLNQRRFDDEVDQGIVDEVSSKYAHLS